MLLVMLQIETKMQKCIRIWIIQFKIIIWGGISSDKSSKIYVLWLRSCLTIKLHFCPYISQDTSPNENFEYSYPLIDQLIDQPYQLFFSVNTLVQKSLIIECDIFWYQIIWVC